MLARTHYIPRSIDDDRYISFIIIGLSGFHPRLFCLEYLLGTIVSIHHFRWTCFPAFSCPRVLWTKKRLVHFFTRLGRCVCVRRESFLWYFTANPRTGRLESRCVLWRWVPHRSVQYDGAQIVIVLVTNSSLQLVCLVSSSTTSEPSRRVPEIIRPTPSRLTWAALANLKSTSAAHKAKFTWTSR
jgi:hypothetical protein